MINWQWRRTCSSASEDQFELNFEWQTEAEFLSQMPDQRNDAPPARPTMDGGMSRHKCQQPTNNDSCLSKS